MSVAKGQIAEIYKVIRKYAGMVESEILLLDLTKTEAYRRNKSFHDTVDRLYTYHHFLMGKKEKAK